MPLGLFTGARLNELCQLRAHDVIQDVYGVDLISINANGFNKSLKNAQSAREIPICSKLIEIGFLDFVEERRQADGKDALLFSELIFDDKHSSTHVQLAVSLWANYRHRIYRRTLPSYRHGRWI